MKWLRKLFLFSELEVLSPAEKEVWLTRKMWCGCYGELFHTGDKWHPREVVRNDASGETAVHDTCLISYLKRTRILTEVQP